MDTSKSSSEPCPYCHSTAELNFSIYRRHYFHCKNCDLIFKGDRQPGYENQLIRHYQKEYFTNYSHDQLTGSRDVIYSHVLDCIEKKVRGGKLLDVGCGCGLLLKEAMNRGWNISGIDPSEDSIAYSKTLLGDGNTHKGTLKDLLQDNVYDVITMINVLDHSSEPWSDIENAGTLLKPEGLIFLRFPNGIVHSTLLKISKCLKFDDSVVNNLVFHEYSFTPRFIRRLLSDYGFSGIVIKNATLSRGSLYHRLFTHLVETVVNSIRTISGGKIIMSSSLEVTARKK